MSHHKPFHSDISSTLRETNRWTPGFRFTIITVLALIIFTGSFFLGRYPEPYITSLTDIVKDDMVRQIVMGIRLPRIITAFLLGMVLSASGMVFQMIFRNPLVDAGFLGVSGGAAFGASLAIVMMGGRVYAIQICAAVFAFLGLASSYGIAARIRTGSWVLRLVLSGIAISAIYASGTGVLKYLADPLRELSDITFWLLGGLWGITWPDTVHVLVVTVPCLIIIIMMRWRLNLLSMQDETAFSLIASQGKERAVLLLAAVISTAAVVSKAGQIGWVGLIIPHITRQLVGSDSRHALPYSLLLGGLFVLLCDDISRTVLSGEIPLGILTSMTGASAFLFLLMNRRMKLTKG